MASVMSGSTALASRSLAGASEDIKRLQGQVDQLRERLDFISPMLPLVNCVQDYFQKVECEASVQLLRLQNAQILPPKRPGEEEGISNATLETVKYFHYLADAITSLHGGGGGGARAGDGALQRGGARGGRGGGSSASGLLDTSSNVTSPGVVYSPGVAGSPASEPPGLAPGRSLPALLAGAAGGGGSLSARASWAADRPCNRKASLAASTPVQSRTMNSASPGSDAPPPAQRAANRRACEGDGDFLLVGSATGSRGSSAVPSARGSSPCPAHSVPDLRSAGPRARSPAGLAREGPAAPGPALQPLQPPAEPGARGAGAGGAERAGDFDGIVLGRGSWAMAVRQASGPRREALRLLCRSGIVTARELSDDLTVIGQEHIDECVHIAGEMLQTWPIEMWARQPGEAKRFFEARLTALYQRRIGERKA